MIGTNETSVTEFILLGFSSVKNIKLLLFGVFLFIYIITVTGNIVIITIVYVDLQLHTPMYFYLGNLSLLEILYTTNIIPRMLFNIITENHIVPFLECIAQLYFFGSLGSTECFLLGVMAYDRYVAICRPLHYATIISTRTSLLMALCSWCTGFIATFGAIILVSQLQFCGPNTINHFFCDLHPVLQLSCKNAHTMDTVAWTLASTILLGSCLLTLASYVRIMMTIIGVPSNSRQKAFSTCTAHLTVVVIFYGAMISMYVSPKALNSVEFNRFSSLLYTVVTPFLNPFIYTLRNQEVKQAVTKAVIRLCGH
ncbi:PREDICTED: olfactory receptor 6F1-like [Nanorana parkeri]|uniref:olfactory receptor 6F1-like n=1 Tax=Nanorana parkeri TaxID=125878 RepID=UPI000854566D|nr:PREDICTED: olfactory receptor 6F1-like [Nanorana parkeri]